MKSIQMTDDVRDSGRQLLRRADADVQNIVVIHPGSGSFAKCWPLEHFIGLARSIQKRFSLAFVIGPAERERWIARQITQLAEIAPLIESPTLVQLAGILSGAGLYIGNDSGVSHLAAVVGTRSVVIFGPTDPVRWRPLGDHVSIAHRPEREWPLTEDVLGLIG
jgi:ADP-heptose:LPS heptosyltransferase